MVAYLLRLIVKIWLRLFHKVEITGLEKIPLTGPVIVACNHCSNADPPVLDYCMGKVRPVRLMGKIELFRLPIIGTGLRQAGAIAVDRRRAGGDLGALRQTLAILARGEMVGMFPEGTRAKDGSPLPPKPGLGFLACKSGAPVVAVGLSGTANFPFSRRIRLRVGGVHRFENKEGGGDSAKTVYAEVSRKVMADIISLTEEDAPSVRA